MKKYFATGQDYRQFSRLFLDSNLIEDKEKHKLAKSNKSVSEGSFFKSYLLIKPDNSKFYDFWQVLMMATYLLTFWSVPYIVCTDI